MSVMKFRDLAAGNPDAVPGVAFESDCKQWRVTAADLGKPPSCWCVWQARHGAWVRRLPWLALADEREGFTAAEALSLLPFTASPLAVRDAAAWHVRRALTGLAVLAFRRLPGGHLLGRDAAPQEPAQAPTVDVPTPAAQPWRPSHRTRRGKPSTRA